MTEADALSTFNFPKTKGLFTTFEDGDEFKLRVLTTDPVVSTKEFTSPEGETNLSTKFGFIVYNFTLEKAQILNAGATITKEIQRIHQDPDFGNNIKQVDIKVKATGNKLTRKYSVQVLPKAEALTNEQIKECQAINLEDKIPEGSRMSLYNPEDYKPKAITANPPQEDDVVIEDIPDEPIDLSNIPF